MFSVWTRYSLGVRQSSAQWGLWWLRKDAGRADGIQRVSAAHAASDHPVNEIEGALALQGAVGFGVVDARALAGLWAGVQQLPVRASCSVGEPSMPEPAQWGLRGCFT